MGGVIGLDFGACQSVAMAMGIPWDEETITVLRHLEMDALKEINKDVESNTNNHHKGKRSSH